MLLIIFTCFWICSYTLYVCGSEQRQVPEVQPVDVKTVEEPDSDYQSTDEYTYVNSDQSFKTTLFSKVFLLTLSMCMCAFWCNSMLSTVTLSAFILYS